MFKFLRILLSIGVLLLGVLSTANAALEMRLGGLAYYDTELNITWAADANINGAQSWWDQMAWASGLTIDGVSGWRLPNADVNGNGSSESGFDNEMYFLYWNEGITAATPGVFSNAQSFVYWSGTELVSDPPYAFIFFFNSGEYLDELKSHHRFAWAVHDGDVALIPEPEMYAMMVFGLAVLLGFGRLRQQS